MGLILLRPDVDLQENVYFGPYLSHYWTAIAILPLATHALHTVSIWLRQLRMMDNLFMQYTAYWPIYVCPFL